MATGLTRFHIALLALWDEAKQARRRADQPFGVREVAKALRKNSSDQRPSTQRISAWTSTTTQRGEPRAPVLPSPGSIEEVIALVKLLSAWAGHTSFNEQKWRTLLEQSLPGRVPAAPGHITGPAGREVRRGFYSGDIDAFRRYHGDADWGDTVDELLTMFIAEPGFHVVTGEAYAGKTALMTKLYEELERRGVPAVIFYVVQYEADQSVHYLPAVITQLLAVMATRDDAYASVTLAQTQDRQRVQYEELWYAFAAGPEPVFLLLDGLDERAAEPGGTGLAKLVPKSAGANGRVVLTTRPNPALDLPRAHPLTRPLDTATHVLTPSPRARAERKLVEHELGTFLRSGDPRGRDLAGVIAVASAPVSDREVAALLPSIGARSAVAALRAPIARSLFVEHAPDRPPRFRFAHRQIRAFVEEELDRDGVRETDAAVTRILDWADRYATAGWPDHTPWFLRENLPTFIASRVAPGQRSRRLTALLNDDYRRLTRVMSGTDRAFFQLLELARDTVAVDADEGEDPVDAFLVEAWSAEVLAFNEAASHTSLTALAHAGLHDQALDAALLIQDPRGRYLALIDLVAVLHQQGLSQALRSAQRALVAAVSALNLDRTQQHERVLSVLVRAALAASDPAAVRSALDAVGRDRRRSVAEDSVVNMRGLIEAELAVTFARSELDHDHTATFLRKQALLHWAAGSPEEEVKSLLAGMPGDNALAVGAQLRARKQCAAGIPVDACLALFADLSPIERAFELGVFARFLADADADGAGLAARTAYAEAMALPQRGWARHFGFAAARVYARAGLHDDAAEIARELAKDEGPAAELSVGDVYEEIACSLTRLGRLDEARELVERHFDRRSVRILARLASAAAETGQLEAALAIARDIGPIDSERHALADLDSHDRVYLGIVEGLRQAGDHEQAREVALQAALETLPDYDPIWRWHTYRRLSAALTAIRRPDLARRAEGQIHEKLRSKPLRPQIDTAAHDVLADAWEAARAGDPDRCAAIVQEEAASFLRCLLSAIAAFCLHRLDRPEEASTRLDALVADFQADATDAALLMAESFRAEPDETAYRECAIHLAEALLREPPPRGFFYDEEAVAYSSLALAGDIGATLARVPVRNGWVLLNKVLLCTCRSLVKARPDDPELSAIVEFVVTHLPQQYHYGPTYQPLGEAVVVELAEITAAAGRVSEASHLAGALVSDHLRAEARSEILRMLPAARDYDGLWALAQEFNNPLHRVLVTTRAVATVLDPPGPAYRRSVRRLFREVRAIADVHERWEALGRLALALLPLSATCMDHYLSRRMARRRPEDDPRSAIS